MSIQPCQEARHGAVVKDWILEPGVAMDRITGFPFADPLRTDARRQPEASEVGGEEGGNLRDASVLAA
jgi:hypothetical protein